MRSRVFIIVIRVSPSRPLYFLNANYCPLIIGCSTKNQFLDKSKLCTSNSKSRKEVRTKMYIQIQISGHFLIGQNVSGD